MGFSANEMAVAVFHGGHSDYFDTGHSGYCRVALAARCDLGRLCRGLIIRLVFDSIKIPVLARPAYRRDRALTDLQISFCESGASMEDQD
jgi:hypothetical protein